MIFSVIIDDTVLSDISGEELETYFLSNKYIQEKTDQTDGVLLNASCTPEEEALKEKNITQAVMTKNSMGGFVNG